MALISSEDFDHWAAQPVKVKQSSEEWWDSQKQWWKAYYASASEAEGHQHWEMKMGAGQTDVSVTQFFDSVIQLEILHAGPNDAVMSTSIVKVKDVVVTTQGIWGKPEPWVNTRSEPQRISAVRAVLKQFMDKRIDIPIPEIAAGMVVPAGDSATVRSTGDKPLVQLTDVDDDHEDGTVAWSQEISGVWDTGTPKQKLDAVETEDTRDIKL